MVLYSMRHGGASSDALRGHRGTWGITKRGRWAPRSSVKRYEKAGLLLQQWQKVPAAVRLHAAAQTRRVPSVLCKAFGVRYG